MSTRAEVLGEAVFVIEHAQRGLKTKEVMISAPWCSLELVGAVLADVECVDASCDDEGGGPC